MYPYDLFLDIDLYTIMLSLGIIAALVTFRIVADRKNFSPKFQNMCIIIGAVAIVFGYFSAVFFQALYNIEKYGAFKINAQTGATFYGGLIGGVAIFLILYFIVGKIVFGRGGEHISQFFELSEIAAASIAIAHSLGRIGCLMAGCCHGAITDKWYGIYMPALKAKAVPIPLYEALFLAVLFAFFIVRLYRKRSGNLSLYMIVYGIWRFIIEYARDDYRGTTIVPFLTPSQLIAILMVIGGILFMMLQIKITKRLVQSEKQNT